MRRLACSIAIAMLLLTALPISGTGSSDEGASARSGLHALGGLFADPRLTDPEKEADAGDLMNSHPSPLPTAVDNSAFLPPVGNQAMQGSCTAWATGYYHTTHNERQERAFDLADPANQGSPAFVYNHINGGHDGGSYVNDALDLICDNGVASMEAVPYDDSDYTSWPEHDWAYLQGMDRRAETWQWLDISGDMPGLKAHLANGDTAVMGIFVWGNFDDIELYDNTYCSSERTGVNRGGHVVTIIGYDDAKATADGTGAFRLVNSWGTGWGDAGFFWMSYSAVVDANIAQPYAFWALSKVNYEPSLVARIHIEHPYRGDIITGSGLSVGIGDESSPISEISFFSTYAEGDVNFAPYQQEPFPSNPIMVDITDLANYLDEVNMNNLFVRAVNSGTTASNSIKGFDIIHIDWWAGNYSRETPVAIPALGTAVANLNLVNGVFSKEPFRVDSDAELADMAKSWIWEGNGTASSPYQIHDYEVNGSGYGGCIFIGNTTDYLTVRNCHLHDANSVSWPYFVCSGLTLYTTQNSHIANNAASYNYVGFLLYYSNKNTLTNNTASYNRYGISLWESSSNTIANNTASYNDWYGIGLDSSSSNTIANNTASYSNDCGICLASSSSNTIINNIMRDDGIVISGELLDWNTHTIDTSNTVNGKPVQYWKNQNGVTVPSGAGQVILANCTNMIVENQNVSDGSGGILLGFSSSNTIANNTASHNYYGINLDSSSSNTIANNTASYNYDGISLWNSISNTIANNTASYNDYYGIDVWESISNTIANNIASHNYYGIRLGSSSSNTIANNNASYNNWYGIILSSSSSNTIANNNASYNPYGIRLGSSISNTIANNIASHNYYGIYLGSSSSYNIIANNTESYNEDGIYLYSSNNNTIENNNVSSNTDSGIFLYGSDQNTLANNIVSSNYNGIGFDNSDYNIITSNTVSNNDFGISFYFSSLNIIYHNNIVDNTDQAWDHLRTNSWDDYYPSGGNYWSDYNGTDLFSGPIQDVPGADGIGDTPYFVNFDYCDYYPLMYLVGSNMPPTADAGPDQTVPSGTEVVFDGVGSADDNGIVNYTWSFTYDGAGVVLWGLSPRFVFDVPGTYSVTLTVSDSSLEVDDDVMTVTVLDADAPVADAGSDRTVGQHTLLVFDGSGSFDNAGIANYTWEFMYDASPVTLWGISPVFMFDTAGSYAVTLTVRDDAGMTDADAMVVTVSDTTSPLADAGADISINQHQTAFFDASDSVDNVGVENYTWSFMYDSAPVELYGISPQYVFDIVGAYTVLLTVTDLEGLTDTDAVVVTVADITPPLASAGNDQNIDQHQTAFLDGSGSTDNVGVVNWTWSFSYRGTPVCLWGGSASFVFDDAGAFVVTLTVRDGAGLEGSDAVSITVNDITAPSALAGTDISIDQHQTALLDGSGSQDNVGVVNWTWEFQYLLETVVLYGEAPSHVFDEAGSYAVTLTVLDDAGNEDTDGLVVVVRDITPPVANAGLDIFASIGMSASFNGSASADNTGVVNFTWSFLYGAVTIMLYGPTPSFVFDEGGVYAVTLAVTDSEGNADSDEVVVTVAAPTLSRTLSTGWNLVSIPTMERSWALEDVLASLAGAYDAVQTYDADAERWLLWSASAPEWMNTLTHLDGTHGYWVHVSSGAPAVLWMWGEERSEAVQIPLTKGWNLVGYPTMNGKATAAQAFAGMPFDIVQICDTNRPYSLRTVPSTYILTPGDGYWVHVTEDCIWTVSP